MFLNPVVTALPAENPTAVLLLSVAVVKFWACRAAVPTATDLLPKVSAVKAEKPTAVLKSASVKASPERPPMSVFSTPVVTDAPAALPTAVLYL